MGTHPIFESDFDCLTEKKMNRLLVAGRATTMRTSKRFGGGSNFEPMTMGYRWQPYHAPMMTFMSTLVWTIIWGRFVYMTIHDSEHHVFGGPINNIEISRASEAKYAALYTNEELGLPTTRSEAETV